MNTEIIPKTALTEICSHRDQALAMMTQAAALLAEGHRLAGEAQELAQRAHGAHNFYLNDRAADSDYRRLFVAFDAASSLDVYRQHLDARVWIHLMSLTRMHDLMDKTAKEEMDKELCEHVTEITEDNVRQVFQNLMGDSQLIFQRGIARAFGDLDRRFKSHDGFKLGSRVILTNVLDRWGGWNYHAQMECTLADSERVFAVLDGKPPNPGALTESIRADRRDGWNPRQTVTETPYFRVRCFKNGNAHLWLKRDDLVEKANLILAEYYGAVLPDASPHSDTTEPLRSKAGLPAKNLSFYATPDAVVAACLQQTHITGDSYVLEPSAGTGNMVRQLLAKGARVDAVEIDSDRVAMLQQITDYRLSIQRDNFLRLPANAKYTHVIMNPPFYGTHWMEHVIHAFDFLAPGGTLVAVLPITAELGESKKQQLFRKWAKAHAGGYGRQFQDLPAESFAASGTRINTVILTLRKR